MPTAAQPTSSPMHAASGTVDGFSPEPPTYLDPAQGFTSIPERIGYLREVCGLDFGWGSSTMMEWVLEHIHIWGGVGWGTSITLLAVLSRLLIFFPAARASDMAAKNSAILPVVAPLRQRMAAAWKSGDRAEIQTCKAQLKQLNEAHGIKTWKMFLPVLIQLPLQFGGFRVLRNMAELPVPALLKENWLWAQDLTLGDPLFILPFANALIMHLTIKACFFLHRPPLLQSS
jgi:YidC/Oxa1 family membrane protein insertase